MGRVLDTKTGLSHADTLLSRVPASESTSDMRLREDEDGVMRMRSDLFDNERRRADVLATVTAGGDCSALWPCPVPAARAVWA